ncbi:hypothetical protein THAOC_08688, partial [Thalassiosira oceanica]
SSRAREHSAKPLLVKTRDAQELTATSTTTQTDHHPNWPPPNLTLARPVKRKRCMYPLLDQLIIRLPFLFSALLCSTLLCYALSDTNTLTLIVSVPQSSQINKSPTHGFEPRASGLSFSRIKENYHSSFSGGFAIRHKCL